MASVILVLILLIYAQVFSSVQIVFNKLFNAINIGGNIIIDS